MWLKHKWRGRGPLLICIVEVSFDGCIALYIKQSALDNQIMKYDLPSVIIEKRAKKIKDSLTKVNYTYTNHVWGLWGCCHSTVYIVIYLCGLDDISCIHCCFTVLIWEPKLHAVWQLTFCV